LLTAFGALIEIFESTLLNSPFFKTLTFFEVASRDSHGTQERHHVSGEFELSALSRGQLVQMVANLQRRLDEQRPQVEQERELIAIYRDTTEREQEAVTQVNHQLLTQIKVFRKRNESLSWVLGRPKWTHPPRSTNIIQSRLTYISS